MLGVGSNMAVLLAVRSRLGSVTFIACLLTYLLTYYVPQRERGPALRALAVGPVRRGPFPVAGPANPNPNPDPDPNPNPSPNVNPNPDLNPNPHQADDFEPAFAALLPPEHYAVHAAQQRPEALPKLVGHALQRWPSPQA